MLITPLPFIQTNGQATRSQDRLMRRFWMAFGTSILIIGLMFAAYLQGVLSGVLLIQSTGLVLSGGAIFYFLFRSGLNRRFADPSLTVPQMVLATFVIEYVMYMANSGRAVFLIMLLMIFLFGLLQLTTRALLLCAAITLGGYGVVIALLVRFKSESLDLQVELLQWCALAITLPWFSVMGGFIGGLRTRLRNRNDELQGLLVRVQMSEAALVDAIESLDDSFGLFDADDRLVLCNRAYAKTFTEHSCFEDIAGMCFEDLVRSSLVRGEVIEAEFRGDAEGWVTERIRRHRDPHHGVFALNMGDGRWLQVSEQHTRGGGIVGVRRDISAQKCTTQLQEIESRVTHALAESATLAVAAPKIIQIFCGTLGWDCGSVWYCDKETQLLRCSHSWGIAKASIQEFLAASSQQGLALESAGVISRVLLEGEARWVADVCTDPHFARAGIAAQAGLRTSFAFPIGGGSEMRGAMEFFIADLSPCDLSLLSVARLIGTQIEQFIARKNADDEIRQLAFHDPLTGLPNRRLLSDRLQVALATTARRERHGALLLIDLDHFKSINDTLGHDKGDLLLQLASLRLVVCVRAGDTVARQGGDEFVIMLTDLSTVREEAALQVEGIGQKILTALNQPYQLGRHVHLSSASIGATLFDGQITETDELLKQADLAMYQSKAAGRNTLLFFETKMQDAVMLRASLETDLRQGLKDRQFLLHYQAQVNDAGSVIGAEVLLRWFHPKRGFISPVDFIQTAEQSGLILSLGRWVLETACQQLAFWAGDPSTVNLCLAVNVSVRQFRHPTFLPQMVELLDRTGIDARKLKLELTESMLIDNIEETIGKMNELRCLGVRLSLDDFGTGYSSLSYLKRLPLNQLKIDQSFVQGVLTDANDAAIVRTIIALGQTLGLEVIAEGVETKAQRDFLSENGCNGYQGYWFSHPLSLADFEFLYLEDSCASASGTDCHWSLLNKSSLTAIA